MNAVGSLRSTSQSLARQSKQLSGKGARVTGVSCMNRTQRCMDYPTRSRAHAWNAFGGALRTRSPMLTSREKIHREKMISRRVIAVRRIDVSVARRSHTTVIDAAAARELGRV